MSGELLVPDRRRHAWVPAPGHARLADGPRMAALLPVGAVEQHGPHLGLGVDIWLATAVATAVATADGRVRVVEPFPFGVSPHHRAFPGTISLRPQTFISVLVDVCRCLNQDGYLPIILNGHGGNRPALGVAVAELGASGVRSAAFSYFDLIAEDAARILPDAATGTGHACALETSLMMHLVPGAVDAGALPGGGTPPCWPDPHLFAPAPITVWRGFEEINTTGVIGKPGDASPERGEALFRAAVRRSAEAVSALLAAYGRPAAAASTDPAEGGT